MGAEPAMIMTVAELASIESAFQTREASDVEELAAEILDVLLTYIEKARLHELIDEADEIRAARASADAQADVKFGSEPGTKP